MVPTSDPAPGPVPDPLAAGVAGVRLVRGGTLRIVAYLGAITTSIASLPFVTRHLHRADYGRYVVVTSLMLIVTVLTEGGITSLGVREFSTTEERERREFMRNLIGIRIALSAAGGVAAVLFTLTAGYPAVVVAGTAIASAGLVLANLQVTLTVPLSAALRLEWLAALDFIAPAMTALLLIVLVDLDAPLLPFFAAAVAAYALNLAVTASLVHGELSLRPAFHPRRWLGLLRESAVFAAATALASIYFQVVIVAMSLLSSPAQTGTFSLAFRVLSVVNGIPVVVVGSSFPILLRAAQDDRERLRNAVASLLEGNLLLGGWLSLLVVAAAPFAVGVLGGSQFPGAADALRILGPGVIATFVAAVFAMTLLSLRRYRTLIATSIVMIGLAVLLCELLIPPHGADGAAIVTLTLEVVLAAVYGTALFAMHPELRPRLALLARIALALALAYAAAVAVPLASLPAAAVGTAALAAAVLALRAMPVEPLRALLRRAG